MATKIYTKTGDAGETSLFGGKRLSKHHVRIEAYGTVDELNAHLGHLLDRLPDGSARAFLLEVQHQLFNIGSQLAADPEKDFEMPGISTSDIEAVEQHIDRMQSGLPPLKQFILPSGDPDASFCHIVRTVCRRAERRIVALHEQSPIDEEILRYLNRLSDYLFVLARVIIHATGKSEVTWTSA